MGLASSLMRSCFRSASGRLVCFGCVRARGLPRTNGNPRRRPVSLNVPPVGRTDLSIDNRLRSVEMGLKEHVSLTRSATYLTGFHWIPSTRSMNKTSGHLSMTAWARRFSPSPMRPMKTQSQGIESRVSKRIKAATRGESAILMATLTPALQTTPGDAALRSLQHRPSRTGEHTWTGSQTGLRAPSALR